MSAFIRKNWPSILAPVVFFGGMALYAVLFLHFHDSPNRVMDNRSDLITIETPVTGPQGIGDVTLHPCATEDSDNCYWFGDVRGNGEGKSFVTIDGRTYYLAG